MFKITFFGSEFFIKVIKHSSVSNPYHFDADPDPRIRFRDDGSGSGSDSGFGSDLKSNKFQFFSFRTHNDVFFVVILSLLLAYVKQN